MWIKPQDCNKSSLELDLLALCLIFSSFKFLNPMFAGTFNTLKPWHILLAFSGKSAWSVCVRLLVLLVLWHFMGWACLAFFFCCCDKSNLRVKGFIPAYSSRYHCERERKAAKAWIRWSYCTHNQEAQNNESWCSSHSISNSSQSPPREGVLPTGKVNFPTSVNLI